ncbi:MAG: hypothetical protein LDLANPLL_02743 [Turneriella sp.]|nr:hypothetical protein [Turneriella sp.]
MPKHGVFRLFPHAVLKPWGGGHLDLFIEKKSDTKIGEYIIFSDLPQFPVHVETPVGVKRLSEFLREELGGLDLSFMVKILSTGEPLSLQNHPSDSDVKSLGLTGRGKFECWTILDAEKNANAYLGLKEKIPVDMLRALPTQNEPLSFFNEVPLKQGDVVFIEPGLIHTTTGRLLFYELQQKSDYTFRIYDFNRNRSLQIEEAIQCVRDQKAVVKNFSTPVETEYFSLAYHRVSQNATINLCGKKMSVITWFGKKATLVLEGKKESITWGDSFLVLEDTPIYIEKNAELNSNPPLENLPILDMLFEAYV